MASSQTLSPTFHGEKFREDRSIMICQAVSCAAKASFLAESKEERQLSRAGRNVLPREGYERGSYSRRREKGETLVELWGTELHMLKFGGGKEFRPLVRIIGTEDTEISFDFLIGSFSLSVSLGVVGSRETDIVFEKSSEFSGKG